ncbi:hypothetical protein HMPREF1548_00335 [Clostridium sp. KLE 1755]|nr:hypothetical protein HMPREF1548_00335 [Clostridium sp. KLE 1755]
MYMNVYNKAIIGYIKMLENFIYCLNSCINCFNIWLYMDLLKETVYGDDTDAVHERGR